MISHENAESVQRMKIRAHEIFLWEENSRGIRKKMLLLFFREKSFSMKADFHGNLNKSSRLYGKRKKRYDKKVQNIAVIEYAEQKRIDF